MRLWPIFGIFALALPMAAAAERPSHALSARPAEVAATLPGGVSKLGTAWAYRPLKASGPLPLLVLLHGAGGDARRFLDLFRADAERRGYALLAPQSAGKTWDLVAQRRFGQDVRRIDEALAQLFAKVPIDAQRIAVGGFSDGASYALSLGLTNPQLFRGILALSPGFAVHPDRTDPTQRIFIAHGRRDPVLAFSNVTGSILPALKAAGSRAETRWFDGGHGIEPPLYDEGATHSLGLSG